MNPMLRMLPMLNKKLPQVAAQPIRSMPMPPPQVALRPNVAPPIQALPMKQPLLKQPMPLPMFLKRPGVRAL